VPIDNARLVIQNGNQWPKERSIAPFFGLPAWWRRFMFYTEVLTARDVTVYLYICSVMDPNAVAYPAIDQIQEDMGIKSRSIVMDSIERLVDRGFLLQSSESHVGRYIGKRTVFQRPSPHHTLLTLLQANGDRGPLIDEELYPLAAVQSREGRPDKAEREKLAKASDEVVSAGLRKLIGLDAYVVYAQMGTKERKKRALVSSLQKQLNAAMENAQAASIRAQFRLSRPENLPTELEQLLQEEEESQEASRSAVPF